MLNPNCSEFVIRLKQKDIADIKTRYAIMGWLNENFGDIEKEYTENGLELRGEAADRGEEITKFLKSIFVPFKWDGSEIPTVEWAPQYDAILL